jgi:hypothetical protein
VLPILESLRRLVSGSPSEPMIQAVGNSNPGPKIPIRLDPETYPANAVIHLGPGDHATFRLQTAPRTLVFVRNVDGVLTLLIREAARVR